MEDIKYVLGLDLGVGSIGWGMLGLDENDIPNSIVDHGVVIFKSLDNNKGKLENKDRRDARGLRRVIRRRKERVRRIKNFLLKEFSMTEEEYYNLFHGTNIIQENDCIDLKIKGLNEELTKEQLVRVLIHYAKNRGFKSNRKNESDNEKGKMKEAIGSLHMIMDRDRCTVSKAVKTYQKENNLDIIHNSDENYYYGFEREDVEKEIKLLLDKQIELGIISEEFKDKYLEIWSSQRDFSEGPGGDSPYKIEWDKVFGKCKFTHENRAPRSCPSFEFFSLIQKLQNIRYYYVDEDGKRVDGRKTFALTNEEVNYFFELSKSKNITYKLIRDYLLKNNKENKNTIGFIDMPDLSKSDFNKLVTKYKKKYDINDKLTDSQYAQVKKEAKEEVYKNEVYVLKSYKEFKKQLDKIDQKEKLEDIDFLDATAVILAYAKTDNAVDQLINKGFNYQFSDEEVSIIKQLKIETKGTGSLSLSLYKDLIELMLDGKTYDEAMAELGYSHSLYGERKTFENGFPTVAEIEEAYDTKITQPNVRNTLVHLRHLYNRLVKEYGKPTYVHVELARDIRNSFSERESIRREQIKNQTENLNAKRLIAQTLGLKDINARNSKSFNADDILKFRLYSEQNGLCAYTGEPIDINGLLSGNYYQVDHILPFSRTFDDSYNNKVLVTSKANQEKKNRTPYEWLGKDKTDWKDFVKRVQDNYKISDQKKNNLLFEGELSFDEFSARSLNDTSYVSKITLNVFKDLLDNEDGNDHVRSFKGSATSFLRKYYKLNKYTHSYESDNYLRSDTEYRFDLDNLKIDGKSGKVEISAKDKYERSVEYKLSIAKGKDNTFKSLEDEKKYNTIKYDADSIRSIFEEIKDSNINEISDYSIFADREESIAAMIVYDALNNIKSQIISKNRNNHLHHEVDALLVASMTRSMQLKITKLNQLLQNIKYDNNKKGYYNQETGEFLVLDEYDNLLQEYGVDIAEKNPKYHIAQPYEHFIDELIVKVFERDEEKLNEKIKGLLNKDVSLKVKYPSFQADKFVSGSLHKETIYGRKKENGVEVNTIRKSVEELTIKDIDDIFDGDKGQKAVKEALVEWFDNNKPTKYPINSKTGLPIKKVKIKDTNLSKMFKISKDNTQKGYAMVAEVVRIQIYTKENDDKLYFVQLSIDKYLKRKNGDLDFDVQVWWGRDSNNCIIKYSELNNNGYNLKFELYPGQHILLSMKDGSNSLAKVIGFTGGQFQVGSILGDNLDLIKDGISRISKDQMRITISTINEIKPVKIDILGNLCLIDN